MYVLHAVMCEQKHTGYVHLEVIHKDIKKKHVVEHSVVYEETKQNIWADPKYPGKIATVTTNHSQAFWEQQQSWMWCHQLRNPV